jgi:hypothetical protein
MPQQHQHRTWCDVAAHKAMALDPGPELTTPCVSRMRTAGSAAQWITEAGVGLMVALDIPTSYVPVREWQRFCQDGLDMIAEAVPE